MLGVHEAPEAPVLKVSKSHSRREYLTCPCYDKLDQVLSRTASMEPEVTQDSLLNADEAQGEESM